MLLLPSLAVSSAFCIEGNENSGSQAYSTNQGVTPFKHLEVALTGGTTGVGIDFANAYAEAMEIVNVRKGSFGNAVNVIKNAISNVVDMINPVLGKENIEKFNKLADTFSKGNLSADSIVEAFGDKSEE